MGRVRMEMTPVTREGRMKRARQDRALGRLAVEHTLVVGAVYTVDRDFGLTPTAVYTGDATPTGRLRFEVVDRQIGESRYFAAKPDAVMGKAADSLAEWCKRGEKVVGAAADGQGVGA